MTEGKILVLDRSEGLAEQVRSAMADFDTEVVSCTKIGSTSHIRAEHEGPFRVIVAGPSLGTRAGIKRLAVLHREMPSTEIVMAFSARPDASLREIVQAGAIDLVELPTEDAVIRAAIGRAFEMAERGRKQESGSDPTTATVTPIIPPKQGRVFTVCSATGGCGKTFYAANLALLLAQDPDARVCIVDLDLQFGELSTALRLQPQYTIVDALRGSNDDDDPVALGQHLDECLVEYDGKFWALSAPKDPAQADEISTVEIARVIDVLRTKFDYVIIDTPTALAETVLAAFDMSEHLFVLATLDLPSVRNLGMFLQTLTKLRIDTENVSLILNKVEKDVGIDVGQIVKLFPQGFRSTIPYAKEVSKSINLGKPVLASFPDSEVSRKLTAGLAEFVPLLRTGAQVHANEDRAPSHGIGRLFKRAGSSR